MPILKLIFAELVINVLKIIITFFFRDRCLVYFKLEQNLKDPKERCKKFISTKISLYLLLMIN